MLMASVVIWIADRTKTAAIGMIGRCWKDDLCEHVDKKAEVCLSLQCFCHELYGEKDLNYM